MHYVNNTNLCLYGEFYYFSKLFLISLLNVHLPLIGKYYSALGRLAFLFLGLHVNGIVWYVLFYVCPFSLAKGFWDSQCCMSEYTFLFIVDEYCIEWIYQSCFMLSLCWIIKRKRRNLCMYKENYGMIYHH